ncbi:hypothetical protein [Streptomyces sp. ICBB 8177]|uniref:hypothetical protein n=1 Tax=Streptomyces sp. ICBB 8177 TaxID=563922 RepID=UPI000D67C3C6|nr:hypothetical protein [Streptomyces sp. ICBB 8177]PWI46208.1 hypothetical protein CK485_00180 [Streptomyces sp. ICBB 8177]
MAPVTRTIFVDYSQYYIHGDDYDTSQWSYDNFNGLVGVLDAQGHPCDPGEFAVVITGLNSGEVCVTVDVRAEPPTVVDRGEWDEIVEASLTLGGSRPGLSTMIPTDGLMELPDFSQAGPGPYRVRVHARGRDAANELMDLPEGTEPVEEHLIQVWGAPATPLYVHKQTDTYGKTMLPAPGA